MVNWAPYSPELLLPRHQYGQHHGVPALWKWLGEPQEQITPARVFLTVTDAWCRADKINYFGPLVLFCISSPVMAFKQFVNVIQLIEASKRLAEGDIETRQKAGLPRQPKLD